jgi:hypothetical protein
MEPPPVMSERAHNTLDEARKTARLFEEQLAVLARQIEEGGRTKRQLTERLNQAARRMRMSETETQWSSALVDATRDFADRAAVFTVREGRLRLRAARGIELGSLLEVPLASAPAFASASESGDSIVAMRQASELSEPVARLVGEDAGGTFSLFPIATRERITALLYADSQSGTVDRNALELLAAIAGLAGGTRPAFRSGHNPELIAISNVERPAVDFALDEPGLHLRAQRFARVRVAQIRLYQSGAVKIGRANHDLYTSLKQDIDSGRRAFRDGFLSASPKMVDYLHLEILRTLANDDAALLGPQYPGPMA